MFIYNSRIKNLKTKLFFMLIVSNFYSVTMRCEKQESQVQELESQIFQYKVFQQEDGSSCGYHALYNGITIAKSLKNPSFKAFLDIDIGRSNYFGSSDSKWVQHIIEKRVNLLSQNYIRDCLLKKLRNIEILTQKPNADCYELNLSSLWVKLNINDLNSLAMVQSFCNMITNVSKIIVESSIIKQEDKHICRISSDDLREAFRQECTRRDIKIDNFDELFIEIFNFTEPFDLEFEIASDSKVVDLNNGEIYTVNWMTSSDKRFNKIDSENQIFTTINPGHWLSSQELESLVDLEKEDPELINLEIFCLDRDIDQLFNQNTGEELLINTQRNFQDINYSGVVVFLIYDSMHWITCIITKNSGEHANFLFADSLGSDYKSYVRARTLIKLLTNTDIKNENSSCLNESEIKTKFTKNESNSAFDIIENWESAYCNSMDRLYIPLEILFDEYTDENVHLIKTDLFIEDLKEGRNFDKSILISGPPKIGKFSLAYSIAVESQLLFVPIAATNLVDATMFNKKDENNVEDTNDKSLDIQPIDIFFYITQKYKSPMVIFIHLLDKLLLKADSKESRKLLIN